MGLATIDLHSLCGSIVANPIIYRLVPSPSRFETRQWGGLWGSVSSSLFSIFLLALSSSHPRQEPFHRLQNPDLRSPCYYGHFLSWRNAHTFSQKENYSGQPVNTGNNGHILKIHYNFISFIRPLKPVMFILSLRSGCVLQNRGPFLEAPGNYRAR